MKRLSLFIIFFLILASFAAYDIWNYFLDIKEHAKKIPSTESSEQIIFKADKDTVGIFISGFTDKSVWKAMKLGLYNKSNLVSKRLFAWDEDEDVLEYIKTIPEEKKIVIIGYSYGADTALIVSKKSNRNIDLLITLDGGSRFNNDINKPQNLKLWINIIASGKTYNFFDFVADIGGQWGIIKSADFNYLAKNTWHMDTYKFMDYPANNKDVDGKTFNGSLWNAIILSKDASEVRKFIKKSWDETVRFQPDDKGTLIGMPYKYTVPSISGAFQEMYYWDTFFTNEGLIRDGHLDLAKSNVQNMLYLVERLGKMPNGNRTTLSNRSQSPYISMMIFEIYKVEKDKKWLKETLQSLEKEYEFWMSKRMTPIGLNRYGNDADDKYKFNFAKAIAPRLGKNFSLDGLSRDEIIKLGSHLIAEAESWDFNPRYKTRCEDFCPIDLNSNLYFYEKNFSYFYSELGDETKSEAWRKKAESRKSLIIKYCRDPETGLYYDYDYVNDKRSDVLSSAVFNLLFAEVLDKDDAKFIADSLKKLEYPYGIATCENKSYEYNFQWAYPNGWAPMQYLAIRGLQNYGYEAEARRIAEKYMNAVLKNYGSTKNLWEKYNVTDGSINVVDEYKMPPMIGWTAGVFIYADEYLKSRN